MNNFSCNSVPNIAWDNPTPEIPQGPLDSPEHLLWAMLASVRGSEQLTCKIPLAKDCVIPYISVHQGGSCRTWVVVPACRGPPPSPASAPALGPDWGDIDFSSGVSDSVPCSLLNRHFQVSTKLYHGFWLCVQHLLYLPASVGPSQFSRTITNHSDE